MKPSVYVGKHRGGSFVAVPQGLLGGAIATAVAYLIKPGVSVLVGVFAGLAVATLAWCIHQSRQPAPVANDN